MLAAIEGAIRASEIPTASHRRNSRRRCGVSLLLASVVILTPSLSGAGIRSIANRFRPIPQAPNRYAGRRPRFALALTISHATGLYSIAFVRAGAVERGAEEVEIVDYH
jgi:hypothetical protein